MQWTMARFVISSGESQISVRDSRQIRQQQNTLGLSRLHMILDVRIALFDFLQRNDCHTLYECEIFAKERERYSKQVVSHKGKEFPLQFLSHHTLPHRSCYKEGFPLTDLQCSSRP